MTTETPGRQSWKAVSRQIEAYQKDLDELRAAMRARSQMEPNSPEFIAALAHEDELLDRIHEWSIRPDPG